MVSCRVKGISDIFVYIYLSERTCILAHKIGMSLVLHMGDNSIYLTYLY